MVEIGAAAVGAALTHHFENVAPAGALSWAFVASSLAALHGVPVADAVPPSVRSMVVSMQTPAAQTSVPAQGGLQITGHPPLQSLTAPAFPQPSTAAAARALT